MIRSGCPKCHATYDQAEHAEFLGFSLVFDAYFCKRCNEWMEGKCDDPSCEYCKDRPDHPPVDDEEKE